MSGPLGGIFLTHTVDTKTNRSPGRGCHASACQIFAVVRRGV